MACFDRENQHLLVHLSCKLAIGIGGAGGDVSYVFRFNTWLEMWFRIGVTVKMDSPEFDEKSVVEIYRSC